MHANAHLNLKHPGLTVVRTWDRDGSCNLMTMRAAIANVGRYYAGESPAELETVLLGGGELRSPLATFTLD